MYRRELRALQSDNYALEREAHRQQQEISNRSTTRERERDLSASANAASLQVKAKGGGGRRQSANDTLEKIGHRGAVSGK